MSRKFILSIDGGGIRGVIPLCALVELEAQLGKPAREIFSFMSGTSTGSIICAGLATGMSAHECLELYRTLGDKVFRFDLSGFLLSLGSFKYRSRALHDALVRTLGNPMLNELPVDVMLTAMRVHDGRPFYFVKDNPGNSCTTGHLRLADCVTASSAAPTFFEPWEVPGIGACIDGGVTIAGNPCYQSCVEAFDYTAGARYAVRETTVVALGTGFFPARGTPDNLIDWIRYVIGQLLEEPADQQTQLVQRHYLPQGARIHRWNPELPHEIAMDSVREIETLISIGTAAAALLDWSEIISDKNTSAQRLPERLPRNRVD